MGNCLKTKTYNPIRAEYEEIIAQTKFEDVRTRELSQNGMADYADQLTKSCYPPIHKRKKW